MAPATISDAPHFAAIAIAIAAGALTYYLADRWVDSMGGEERLDFEGAQAEGSGTAILLGRGR